MRDYKKFCRPKTTNNPKSGDYKVTLNEGTTVYVDKNEFEKKTNKYFKNYQVIEDNEEDNYDYSQDYFTIISLEDNNEIKWKCTNNSVAKTIYVSIDNGLTWNMKTSSNTGVSLAVLNNNNKLLVKGNNKSYGNMYYCNNFMSSGNFNVSGNIMSLIDGDDFANADLTKSYDFEFQELFYNCIKLINAKNLILPITTPSVYCYVDMFENCTGLITAPELPATTLSAYCYEGMFKNCTNLIAAPKLPATTLADYCYYNMFKDCTSLTTTPELFATTLAGGCYNSMFENCISLSVAPELPVATLMNSCYNSMFKGCTSLTTAPELPATILTDWCYYGMFDGCTSLNYIKCLATDISATNCITDWVNNVASTGTFIKANEMNDWTIGTSGIPEDWEIIEI